MSTRQAYPPLRTAPGAKCAGCGTRVGKLKALLKMPDGTFRRARAFIHARLTPVYLTPTTWELALLCPACRKIALGKDNLRYVEPAAGEDTAND